MIQIRRKVGKDPAVELKSLFTEIPIGHPLRDGVIDGLPGELILQFQRNQRNTVDREHHVHALFGVAGAVVPLPDALADVLFVPGKGELVQLGFRFEIDDPEFLPPMLETMTKDVDQAVHIHGVLKGAVELCLGIALAALLKEIPGHRLSILHESAERADIEGIVFNEIALIVTAESDAVTGISGFLPSAGRGDQIGFNVSFKLFFIIWHS